MRFRQTALLFLTILTILTSCNRPPELSEIPEISFNDIEFRIETIVTGQAQFQQQVLSLSLNVQDGDGDLGLAGDENGPPYQPFTLVFQNGDPVEFGQRPGDPPFSCLDYVVETIDFENRDINGDGDQLDTLLIDFNEDQYNIFVDFFQKRNGVFEEIDLRAQPPGSNNARTFCGITYDGRFPCLSTSDDPCNYVDTNDGPIEGVITYDMKELPLLQLFRTDTIQLVFQIQDRARNKSNIVETPEFTLQGILAEDGN